MAKAEVVTAQGGTPEIPTKKKRQSVHVGLCSSKEAGP